MVQAKLNALLYTEEAYHWLDTRLKLRPASLPAAEGAAAQEGRSPSLVDDAKQNHERRELFAISRTRSAGRRYDPYSVPLELYNSASWQNDQGDRDARRNAFFERLSQYFMYAINRFCGSEKFNLSVLITSCFLSHNTGAGAGATMAAEAKKKMHRVLNFLLHLRSPDYREAFSETATILIPLKTKGNNFNFNQGVMLLLVETFYLFNEVCLGNEADYAQVLARLLGSKTVSVTLKAAVCRQVIAACHERSHKQGGEVEQDHGDAGNLGGNIDAEDETMGPIDEEEEGPGSHASAGALQMSEAFLRTLLPALLAVMKDANQNFLQAVSTAAVVNLCQCFGYLKNLLLDTKALGMSVLGLLEKNLFQRKDDSVIEYTLLLLTNLTKSARLRELICKQNTLLPELVDTLLTHYSTPFSGYRLLTPLCAIIGQLANDDKARQNIQDTFGMSILDCCLYIQDCLSGQRVFDTSAVHVDFHYAVTAIVPLKSKTYFVLKQLCVNSSKNKLSVGLRAVEPLVHELFLLSFLYNLICEEDLDAGGDDDHASLRREHLSHWREHVPTLLDCFINLLTLLTLLSIHKKVRQHMVAAGIQELFAKKTSSHYEVIVDKIANLKAAVLTGF
ncbi:unnamed protein product [Amoebophrya sp. A25]|nr:unnamed protein product [Amoebophrya sp. A25]|eukprot:GSA25T00023068001.1